MLVDTRIPWMLMLSTLSFSLKMCSTTHLAKANRASHGPRVRAKARVKKARENPKEPKVRSKVPKAHTRVKNENWSRRSYNSKSETRSEIEESAPTCPTDASWNDWNDDWSSVGWHKGWEQKYDTSATSFSLRGLDVSATSIPKRFERVIWIPDGGVWQFQGYDENGLVRSLKARLIGVHKVLCSAAKIACEGRQVFYLGHDGGYTILIHSKMGQGM